MVLSLAFPVILGAVGLTGSFIGFAVVNVVIALLMFRNLPETRGVSLEQVERWRDGRQHLPLRTQARFGGFRQRIGRAVPPGGGAARLAICVERLVCGVLCEELVEADAVAVIFGTCLAKSLNVEELFVLFQ